MSDEDNVIDVEAVEIVESDNLPALAEQATTHARGAPMEGRDWATYARPERRCTASSSRTGEQCKNAAIKGHNVCRYHGGAAKQVKQAAQTRLDNAAEVMAKQLLGIALSADSEAVKLAAVRDALDRTIGKAPTTVEIGPTKPYEELFDDIAEGVTRAESRRARGVPDTEDNSAGFATGTEGLEPHPPTQGETELPTEPPVQPTRREFRDPTTDTRDFTRERESQPPVRHVCGDDAIRLANEANRQIGALKALPPGRTRR